MTSAFLVFSIIVLTSHPSALAQPPTGPETRAAGAASHAISPAAKSRLLAAYPDHLSRIEGGYLIWRDGSRMALDVPLGPTSTEGASETSNGTAADALEAPTLADMLALTYPPASAPLPTSLPTSDPGRHRPTDFFVKIYGDCRAKRTAPKTTRVIWLPGTPQQSVVRMTKTNNVARRLAAVSRELAKLPSKFHVYLSPPAGGMVCRTISGTKRLSPHSFGIAVDIATRFADYWRWTMKPSGGAPLTGNSTVTGFRNRVPREIVSIFERHGFIWGGRWRHYDTMHFEYRPELLPPIAPLASD